ncbi:MAG: hypothetical protein ACT4PV_12595 [Planctomycetaceae bacterium]
MHTDEELSRFLEGGLPPERAAALAAAIDRDAALRSRIEELRLLKEQLFAGAPAPPPDFPERIARLAEAARPAALDLDAARRFLRRLAWAAAILAAIGLTALATRVLPEMRRPVQAAPVDRLLGR